MNNSITIVTAFFDIGRSNWNAENGHSNRLERNTDTYFSYFNKLAELDNEIIIFTSDDLKEKVLSRRKGKPTTVITIDIYKKFKHLLNRISKIQNSDEFKKLIKPEQLKNPEYWSAEYVLINNLKTYFVNKAINLKLTHNELIAWIDFGYIRKDKTIYGIKNWYHPFNPEKIHLFSIRDDFKLEDMDTVLSRVINNETFIIGGVLVSSKNKWAEFHEVVTKTQKQLLNINIIDDDQGVFLMCTNQKPNLVQIHYLGHMEWFRVFKLFHRGSNISYLKWLKIILRLNKPQND
ncbi:protein YibB [Moellerella wisconsensis]|uniref:protein YibB n=1 Tax=Moellerella wisconsensis TaxID=158849 RepID=UPI001F4E711D|nr:protein YibB [Moellerella wisconsensis]UNH27237.1 protein YibB [Moellerella wisconsensis]